MTTALDYTYLGAGMGVLLLLALGWSIWGWRKISIGKEGT